MCAVKTMHGAKYERKPLKSASYCEKTDIKQKIGDLLSKIVSVKFDHDLEVASTAS
jgi:hypothetical protein